VVNAKAVPSRFIFASAPHGLSTVFFFSYYLSLRPGSVALAFIDTGTDNVTVITIPNFYSPPHPNQPTQWRCFSLSPPPYCGSSRPPLRLAICPLGCLFSGRAISSSLIPAFFSERELLFSPVSLSCCFSSGKSPSLSNVADETDPANVRYHAFKIILKSPLVVFRCNVSGLNCQIFSALIH